MNIGGCVCFKTLMKSSGERRIAKRGGQIDKESTGLLTKYDSTFGIYLFHEITLFFWMLCSHACSTVSYKKKIHCILPKNCKLKLSPHTNPMGISRVPTPFPVPRVGKHSSETAPDHENVWPWEYRQTQILTTGAAYTSQKKYRWMF